MADTESGARWWLRYVVIPLLGGGGVIAIIVTATTQHQKPDQDHKAAQERSSKTDTGEKPTAPAGSSEKEGSAEPVPAAGADAPLVPPTVDGGVPESAATEFALYDKETNDRLLGSVFPLPVRDRLLRTLEGEGRGVLRGTLVLRDTYSPASKHVDVPVKNKGTHDFHCFEPDRLVLQLIDPTSDGDNWLIREIQVTCD